MSEEEAVAERDDIAIVTPKLLFSGVEGNLHIGVGGCGPQSSVAGGIYVSGDRRPFSHLHLFIAWI
jgi:hypothetical protein